MSTKPAANQFGKNRFLANSVEEIDHFLYGEDKKTAAAPPPSQSGTSSSSSQLNPAQNEYRLGYEEIQRRKEQAKMYASKTSLSTPTSSAEQEVIAVNAEANQPGQNFFLMNFAHVEQLPLSQFPAFRVLGAVEDPDRGMLFGQQLSKELPDTNIFLIRAGDPVVICKSVNDQRNPAAVDKKRKKLLKHYFARLASQKKQFEENVAEKKMGDVGQSNFARKFVEEHEKGGGQERTLRPTVEGPREYPRQFEKRNQSFAVITYISDLESYRKGHKSSKSKKVVPEPLLIVWAAFAAEKDANEYVEKTVKEKFKHYDFSVVCMYEWLSPEEVDEDEIQEVYVQPELDAVMKYRKVEKKAVADLEKKCMEEKKQVPIIRPVNSSGAMSERQATTNLMDVLGMPKQTTSTQRQTTITTPNPIPSSFQAKVEFMDGKTKELRPAKPEELRFDPHRK